MPNSNEFKRHIIFSGRFTPEAYTSPKKPGSSFQILQRQVSEHGQLIREKLVSLRDQATQLQNAPIPDGLVREDFIYIDFISDFNVNLAIESFEDNLRGNYHLLSCQKEENQFRALVAINPKGLSTFIKKVEAYESKVTKKNNPKHARLFSNILDIRLATLKSFWNEPLLPFPQPNQQIWWEIWIRRENMEEDTDEDAKVRDQLAVIGVQVPERRLLLPEHVVRLANATADQLGSSLILLDNLAELRKAKDTVDFFVELTGTEQREWVQDLLNRVNNQGNADSIAICLLDTGVQNGHPLISPFLPNSSRDSFNPAWGNDDGHPNGHGTQMAGLALYGDLTAPLSHNQTVTVSHQLESIKIINASAPHQPDLYGQVTIECANRAVVLAPMRKRIYCMSVTSEDNRDHGKPSSWSSAVDNIAFGETGVSDDKVLFVVSGGNVFHDNHLEYPAKNKVEFVHDPAQSFNALSIGGYTEKDTINLAEFPGAVALAPIGNMAPCNSTSMLSESKWPIKPDFVMEAGNYAVQGNDILYLESLQLLTTAKDFNNHPFTTFRDTSAAAAMASNFLATIYSQYRDLWPETIRAIAIQSAKWTSQMSNGVDVKSLGTTAKRELVRCFGYGVPDLNKALYSLTNSVTLIAQRTIQPFKLVGSLVKTNQLHFFDLPWPTEALQALAQREVKLTVTLSYFVEPNPGNKYFSSKYLYQSHGLRFAIKRPLESVDEFRARINKAARDEDDEPGVVVAQNNGWLLGERIRNSGTIHKDVWSGTGAELAAMGNIAVFPVNGWWRLRKKEKRYEKQVRYSLIVNIESESTEVDLYTPIENLIVVNV